MSSAPAPPTAILPSTTDFPNPLLSSFAIAFHHQASQSYITVLTIPPSSWDPYANRDSCYIAAIHQKIQHFKAHETVFSRLFGKHQLGFAKVAHRLAPDPTASCSCSQAYISDFRYHWHLTRVIHNPRHQFVSATNTEGLDPLPITLENGSREIKEASTLTVRRVIDKTKVMWLIASLSAAALPASILLSAYTQKTELGIGLFTGLIVLASFIQTFALYFSGKSRPFVLPLGL